MSGRSVEAIFERRDERVQRRRVRARAARGRHLSFAKLPDNLFECFGVVHGRVRRVRIDAFERQIAVAALETIVVTADTVLTEEGGRGARDDRRRGRLLLLMRWDGADYRWGIGGVNYDAAFRNIVRGVVLAASGTGSPDQGRGLVSWGRAWYG